MNKVRQVTVYKYYTQLYRTTPQSTSFNTHFAWFV